ncbi:MAG: YHS domain-containing (seleno)protein [Alphaproteobacteria bacterium]
MRHLAAAFLTFALGLFALAAPGLAKEPEIYAKDGNVAINGYDPVSYFDGMPMPGKTEHTLMHRGAEWRFASAGNLAKFKADPAAYEPQYGGYCAYAVSYGSTAKTEPDAWKIVDGKLYLNYDKNIQSRWENDIPGHIEKADANWPKVLE